MNTLDRMAFEQLTLGDVRIPRTWASSVRTYERLVAQELAAEIKQPNEFIRQFTLIERTT